ncbi:Predicted glycosyl hydrolase [Natronincola peptidivorans]|uniref:Predicted glycosyl hydrolase n=1 Tax=Natronincola peptidivorans TaxID=426128 RepID=A0A1I0DNM9_9FIRM|nr:S-layer homology domain-containing protein [Natronincola peptidivorans]SET34135.1 Predicted glycosyl hydrolase [Natronincola peptidivorans]
MGKHKRIISLIFIAMFICTSASFVNGNTVTRFNDVPNDHWANEAVHELRLLGITNGIGENQFGMGYTISRNEFVTFLVKLMGWELVKPEEGSFADNRDATKWYYAPVETAVKHGAISLDSNLFRGEEPITREEMAVMIVRALGYETLANQLDYLGSPFNDVSQNTGYITVARDFGIISGVGNNLFAPRNTARREEAAVMMMRMHEKLNGSIDELHAFYAIQSSHQSYMMPSLDSVSFGWSRLEYDATDNKVVLNTTRSNDNEYGIPAGFSQPLNLAKENNVSTQLMVFAENNTLINTDTKTNMPLVEYIITNPEIRREVIAAIISQITSTTVDGAQASFNGVVIDFENMRGNLLKQSFNVFLSELRQELTKTNKSLYVAVHPARRSGQAYYDGYDFRAIGELADKVILMAHDYNAKQLTDTEMQSGYATTPLAPIDEIYYALRTITDKTTGVQDLNRIWLQLSFDSAQWKLKDGRVINKYPFTPSYEAIQQRLLMDGVTINYSNRSHSPYATFFDSRDETNNVLWYEDARSIQAKIDLAKMFGLQGISLWRLGNIPDYKETSSTEVYLDIWHQILNNTK